MGHFSCPILILDYVKLPLNNGYLDKFAGPNGVRYKGILLYYHNYYH